MAVAARSVAIGWSISSSSIAFLTKNRRYAVLLSAVATAILTPTPDAYTMSMLLVPLLGLYEVSIILLRIVEHRAARQTTSAD